MERRLSFLFFIQGEEYGTRLFNNLKIDTATSYMSERSYDNKQSVLQNKTIEISN